MDRLRNKEGRFVSDKDRYIALLEIRIYWLLKKQKEEIK